MPRLFVVLILVAILTVAGLVATGASMSQYLTALIALAALTVSVVSAFKEDIFPFRLHVLLDEVVFAPHAGTSESPVLILPIAFLNEGYGSGIIEGLSLKVEQGDSIKIYTPIVEVDYQKYVSGKRGLHSENILCTFHPFRLGGRESVKKYFAFTQEEKSKRYPFNLWAPGKHTFRLFGKHTGRKAASELGSVCYQITEEILGDYRNKVGASISANRELHV